jgi:hypothetical protein
MVSGVKKFKETFDHGIEVWEESVVFDAFTKV